MVVTIDAYIWWRSLTVTIHILVRVKKCHHNLIGDGQKSIRHQKLIFVIPYEYQGTMESNHQPPALQAGALLLSYHPLKN